jgi:hypothetical protein
LPLIKTQSIQKSDEQFVNITEGQILFGPLQSKITYLIDKNGIVNHTWASDYTPGEAVYMLNDGSILRSIKLSLSMGGAGGGIQKIAWDGTLLWDFRYFTDDYLSHHDLKVLPDGNILLIAWEYKTRDEAIAAGRDPDYLVLDTFMPDHVAEVKQTGLTTGDIVWEWHVWDHLIQDYDPLKANYGVVADHPELVDLNYGAMFHPDWLHVNSIDYNERFDQILLSVRDFNEIWVIDHSTTTEEAAGHTGGNSGKGGDIIYRWGNPQAYGRGTASDQKFYFQHDATWIKPGCPGNGNILVFNNGLGRPNGYYSSVDEIIPPVNDSGSYYIGSGASYGPTQQTWIYTSNPPTDFYSSSISGASRLSNGNTLICIGNEGVFIEVTPEKEVVWQYENIYPNSFQNNVFKIQYIPPEEPPEPGIPDLDCDGNLNWVDVKSGVTLDGNFIVQNVGDNGSVLNWTITSFPDWGTWYFNPDSGENLKPEDGSITVEVSVVSPNEKNKDFNGFIRIENQNDSEDFDVVPIYLKTTKKIDISIFEYIHNLIDIFLLKWLKYCLVLNN